MDELNHDFQALALEGRAMGEVSERPEGKKKTTIFCEGEEMKYQFFEAAGLIVMLRVLRSAWEVCLCLSVCVCG